MAQIKKKKKRKTMHIPEELHKLIKEAAQQNNRKIIDELKERFSTHSKS